MNYSLRQIADICNGTFIGRDYFVKEISIDSRNFSSSDKQLFIAISGRNHDGHDYINELYFRGVRAFVIERDIAIQEYPDAGFIRVDSSVLALQSLASYHRSCFPGQVVAITGSNGKTIVKEWVAAMAPDDVKLFRSPKSYNSQIGVPLSILMIEGDEQIAIIEAGISEVGEMERLERVIKPNIGVVTTIGDAHQENFISVESKLEEKLILFSGAREIIYNSSYTMVDQEIKHMYGSKKLTDSALEAKKELGFTLQSSLENAAMALTICKALGFDYEQCRERLTRLKPIAMRLELKEGIGNSLIINDSYNSDINSLSIAIDYLNSVAGNRRRTLIVSDIPQSGYTESDLYQRVAELVSRSGISLLVGIGARIREYAHLFRCEKEFYHTTESYLSSVSRTDFNDCAILIKGSRASQFERLANLFARKSHTTTLEIDMDAMVHNLNVYRSLITPKTKMMAMVKASGYGNGTFELANMLQIQGVDYLAVAFADEGVTLRERGISMPIVVLNADADSFDIMISNRLEPEIYSFTSLRSFITALDRFGERSYPIHIKLDTGMHRLGITKNDIPMLVEELSNAKGVLHVMSIFSHLAAADDPQEDSFTAMQIENFEQMSNHIASGLGYTPMRHIANSSAIERFPQAQFDMVRLGIGLYGVSTLETTMLRNVSRLRTRIVQIKELTDSDTVGYGRAGHLSTSARIATIPVGYADGINRYLGCGNWEVLVGGVKVPTIGRICMDTCMIDVTRVCCSEGDEVEIFGSHEGCTVSDMARVLGTIPYEIMTGISTRVKRIYTKE